MLQTAWRLYWDKQLLKVLDAQFARDLQNLLQRLPPQHVRLAYAEQAVQFEPQLDDVRAAFYRDHLDAYITIPCQVSNRTYTCLLLHGMSARRLLELPCVTLAEARKVLEHFSFFFFTVSIDAL